MKELSSPSGITVPWKFRATIPAPEKCSQGTAIRIVSLIVETTVHERLYIEARGKAAQILGVEPGSLEHVT